MSDGLGMFGGDRHQKLVEMAERLRATSEVVNEPLARNIRGLLAAASIAEHVRQLVVSRKRKAERDALEAELLRAYAQVEELKQELRSLHSEWVTLSTKLGRENGRLTAELHGCRETFAELCAQQSKLVARYRRGELSADALVSLLQEEH